MTRLIPILCLLAVAAGKPKPGPAWAKSWSAAVEEGRALNLPIVVHRHGFY